MQLAIPWSPVIHGTADVLPVTVTGSYAKLGHFWLRQFAHSGALSTVWRITVFVAQFCDSDAVDDKRLGR
jgi:hypothetical protein